MKLKNILLESGAIRKLFHFTNIKALLKILQDGKIKLSSFPHTKYGDKTFGLSTVRPSMTSNENLLRLSDKIGGVKFILQANKLSDKIRGVKIKPISEFPTNSKKNLISALELRAHINTKKANSVANQMLKLDLKKIGIKELKSWLLKRFDKRNLASVADVIWYYIRNYQNLSKKREGEERILTKKPIPLNKEFISIELLNDFLKFNPLQKTSRYEWKEIFPKWEHLFIKNNIFKEFKKRIFKT